MAGFVPRKRRVTTTADTAHRFPDLLEGDFGASAPDVAWVGDISYIRTCQGFLYLAFVLDLASRRVVGVYQWRHTSKHHSRPTRCGKRSQPEAAKRRVWCSTPTAAANTRLGLPLGCVGITASANQ